jgi:2-oxoglutarate ferredoxin oxidoreductase subunit alpha
LLQYENKARGELVKQWEAQDTRCEEFMLDGAEYVIVAYGIAARCAKAAVLTLRERGVKIGLLRPITLLPFPKKILRELDYGCVRAIIDVEMTIPAQMRDDIALEVMGRAPIYEYGTSGGILLDDDGVLKGIEKIIEEAEA